MSQTQLDSLIKMVNQIAQNNSHQTQDESVTLIVNHLKKFWALSMKKQIIDYTKQGGDALIPLAKFAVEKLSQEYA